MSFSTYKDRDVNQLATEARAGQKLDRDRLAKLEAFEAYVRDELYPYLVSFAAFTGFTAVVPKPPA